MDVPLYRARIWGSDTLLWETPSMVAMWGSDMHEEVFELRWDSRVVQGKKTTWRPTRQQ